MGSRWCRCEVTDGSAAKPHETWVKECQPPCRHQEALARGFVISPARRRMTSQREAAGAGQMRGLGIDTGIPLPKPGQSVTTNVTSKPGESAISGQKVSLQGKNDEGRRYYLSSRPLCTPSRSLDTPVPHPRRSQASHNGSGKQ